jgi:hypothetical protein
MVERDEEDAVGEDGAGLAVAGHEMTVPGRDR